MSSVPAMFDRIAPRYDLINRVLSFGMDIYWRKRAVREASAGEPGRVLDVATGTGDLLIALLRALPRAHGTGLDPSAQMLAGGRAKVERSGLSERATLVVGAAEILPFTDASFDVVTIGFGIRNAEDRAQALREMRRVLAPGGHLVVLEFATPTNMLFRSVYFFYLRNLLPIIGGFLSGDREAYRYLNRTIEAFPSGKDFETLLTDAGFQKSSSIPLALGAVRIYVGET